MSLWQFAAGMDGFNRFHSPAPGGTAGAGGAAGGRMSAETFRTLTAWTA